MYAYNERGLCDCSEKETSDQTNQSLRHCCSGCHFIYPMVSLISQKHHHPPTSLFSFLSTPLC